MSLLDRWRRRREARLCTETHDRINEIIDAEITPGRKRARLEQHIDACVACGADAGALRELKQAVARVGTDPDAAVKARLLELVDGITSGTVDLRDDEAASDA